MAWAWTDERVDELKDLHKQGLSFGQIQGRMGAPTRNVVSSKADRLGLKRLSVTRERAARPRKPKARSSSFAFASFDPEPMPSFGPDLVIPPAERKTLVQLDDHDCRWPIGDPQHADFYFCGKRKVQGISYCEFHAWRAFAPPQTKRHRAEPSTVRLVPMLEAAE